jgi:hypothetical protein
MIAIDMSSWTAFFSGASGDDVELVGLAESQVGPRPTRRTMPLSQYAHYSVLDKARAASHPLALSDQRLALLPYAGPPLAIGAELDKLAWNIGMGRNFAGIHWRSDVAAGLEMGETVALAVVREMKLTGNELFSGFSLRRLDGARVTI